MGSCKSYYCQQDHRKKDATIGALMAALERIERWQGEFPATGKFWENTDGTISDRPISYGAQNGSNGERDFMRAVARDALALGRE
jgi:hypothetical protein